MSGAELRLDIAPPVASIVLARPAVRNAMSLAMALQLEGAVDELNRADGVRAVILRGEGQSFSGGGDFGFIEERIRSSAEENRRAMLRFYGAFLAVRHLRMPTIAALHGSAVGAGLCLALACDLRVAAEGTKLAANFVRIGLHPGMGATYLLPRVVGPARAAELLLTGKTIDADYALRIGLVNEVVPLERLPERAAELAREIAAAAPIAVAQTKQSLLQERSLEEALAAEAFAQAIDYGTEDMKEGVRAFRERTPPRFSGR